MKNSIEIFDSIEKLSIEVRSRKTELNSSLSIIDKEITDIRHYIEFYPMNACQGYKLAKMLKDRLIERRKIKNEMENLESVLRMDIGYIGKGKGREALETKRVKQYRPRVLSELFEGRNLTSQK